MDPPASNGNGTEFPQSPVTAAASTAYPAAAAASAAPSPSMPRLSAHQTPLTAATIATPALASTTAPSIVAPAAYSIHDGTVVDESAACGVPILDPAALAAMTAVFSAASSSSPPSAPAGSPASLHRQHYDAVMMMAATHHQHQLAHYHQLNHNNFAAARAPPPPQLPMTAPSAYYQQLQQPSSSGGPYYAPSRFVQPQYSHPAAASSNVVRTRRHRQQQDPTTVLPPYPAAAGSGVAVASHAAVPTAAADDDDDAAAAAMTMTFPPHRFFAPSLVPPSLNTAVAPQGEPTMGTVVGTSMPPAVAGDAEAQAIFAAAAMAVLHHEEYRRQQQQQQQQMMPSNYAGLYGVQRPLPPPLPSTHMAAPTFGDAAPGAPVLNVQPPRAGSPQLPYQQQQTPHQQLAEQFGVGQWSTSLFACLVDPASAIDAFLCFRCQASRQRNVILNGANDLDCNTLCFTLAADIMLAIVGLPSLAQVLLVAEIRRTLRTRYGIAGTTGRDFTAAVCCHCCVLAQHYREMSVRGEWPAGECVTRPFLNGVVDLQNMV